MTTIPGVSERVTYAWRRRTLKGGKLPATRNNAGAVVHQGVMYMVGGAGAGTGRTSEVWRYRLRDDLWELVPNKGHDNPPSRDGHSCVHIGGGSLLVFGGQGSPSHNEKSERNLDLVRTKTYLVRDLYNDLFKYDIDKEMWTMMCPEGGVPLCRRGHSAIFVPAGSYIAPQSHSQGHGGGIGSGSGSSPGKGGKKKKEDPYPAVPQNSMVVFGGSGMEVSKYIEAVYNDVWVHSVDVGRWAKVRTRGAEPKPLFGHRAERVGELMVVVGGITSTNAKPFVSDEPVVDGGDVMILNLSTVTWSYLDLFQGTGHLRKAARLNLHGHSLCVDPYEPNSGMLFVFGGKETVDGRKAASESAAGAKRLLRKARPDNCTLRLDVHTGTITPVDYPRPAAAAPSSPGSAAGAGAGGDDASAQTQTQAAPAAPSPVPELRYQHVCSAVFDDSLTRRELALPKRNYLGDVVLPPPREEPVLVVLGGSRVEHGGYCDNLVFELVRSRGFVDNSRSHGHGLGQGDGVSVGGGEAEDGASVHSHAQGASGADGDGQGGAPLTARSVHSTHSVPSIHSQSHHTHSHSVHSTHSTHSGAGDSLHESSFGASPHDEGGEDEEDRKPSIWDKVQAQRRLAGQAARDPEPNNWAELKLALTSSLTEKRTHASTSKAAASGGQGHGQGQGQSQGLGGRHGSKSTLGHSQSLPAVGHGDMSSQTLNAGGSTAELGSSGILAGGAPGSGSGSGQAPPMSAALRAREAKRAKERIKAMSDSQVLPLVQGQNLSFIRAKNEFLARFPPYVPPPVGATAAALPPDRSGTLVRASASRHSLAN